MVYRRWKDVRKGRFGADHCHHRPPGSLADPEQPVTKPDRGSLIRQLADTRCAWQSHTNSSRPKPPCGDRPGKAYMRTDNDCSIGTLCRAIQSLSITNMPD